MGLVSSKAAASAAFCTVLQGWPMVPQTVCSGVAAKAPVLAAMRMVATFMVTVVVLLDFLFLGVVEKRKVVLLDYLYMYGRVGVKRDFMGTNEKTEAASVEA